MVPETVVIRPQGGGRRRTGDRECLAAIVFVVTSGCTWRQVPPLFGPAWPTVYRRFARWSKDGIWARLHRVVLDELDVQGELDCSRFAIDSGAVERTMSWLAGCTAARSASPSTSSPSRPSPSASSTISDSPSETESKGGSPRRRSSVLSAAERSPYPPSPGCDQSCAVTLAR
ncbi:transposase [Streptomyces sp. cmx-10-25]|uniref:transposase n=1 Tax=Streptomyces sp. cmx-10-25 TaxID=2790919 RepID=UPI00397FC4C2